MTTIGGVWKYIGEVVRMAMSDVTESRVMAFKVGDAECVHGLRISPVGLMEEKGKFA